MGNSVDDSSFDNGVVLRRRADLAGEDDGGRDDL
jgi:hypothetical protein